MDLSSAKSVVCGPDVASAIFYVTRYKFLKLNKILKKKENYYITEFFIDLLI